MKRIVAVVVPQSGKFLRALVREDGQVDLGSNEVWDKDLEKAFGLPTFRTLVIPENLEYDEETANFWVRRIKWTPYDQDYWIEYLKKVVEEDPTLFPEVLTEELGLFVRAIQATKAKRWSQIMLNSTHRFASLWAYLLGLKELKHIRESKQNWGVISDRTKVV